MEIERRKRLEERHWPYCRSHNVDANVTCAMLMCRLHIELNSGTRLLHHSLLGSSRSSRVTAGLPLHLRVVASRRFGPTDSPTGYIRNVAGTSPEG